MNSYKLGRANRDTELYQNLQGIVSPWSVESVTMDTEFCCATLSRGLMKAIPEIFKTDQGFKYMAKVFIDLMKAHPTGSAWMAAEAESWTMFS